MDHILDRDDELQRLAGALDRAAAGSGSVLLVSGPAGIGKTVLLREARRAAQEHGGRVLAATASPLDRSFPFGLAHQLFDEVLAAAAPERRERLLAGAASRAEVVLSPASGLELPEDPGHAVLHGLFWFVANLAEEGPLTILVDDLHWADRASLRLLEYLARRLEALPVAVVATTRPNEPGAEHELLLALEAAATASVVRPAALGTAAVAALLEEALGATPHPAFTAACRDATGGNPLLLRSFAAQAAERGLRGSAREADDVAGLAAVELGVLIRRRLGGLGPDAVGLAAAAAVLGAPARLDDLAELAGLTPAAARAAADLLAAAQLLEAPGWGFVHPIVRSAVVESTAPAERARLHALAARQMRAVGAHPARIAVHLLATDPAGDPEVVAELRAAARAAAAEGVPEAGVAQLRRALAEPPPPEERAGLLLELGELEERAGDAEAIGHLTAALEAGLTGDAAARALAARAAVRIHVDPVAVLGELAAAEREATDPALRFRLQAALLETSVFHEAFVPERARLLAAGGDAEEPSPVLLAHRAAESAFSAGPVEEVVATATAAVDGDVLQAVGPANSTFNLLVHAFRCAERPGAARGLLDEGEALARREGLRFADFFLEHASAYWHWDFGSVAAGVGQARTGLDKVRTGGFEVTAPALVAILAELLVEADELDDAAAVVDELAPGTDALTVGEPFALTARGVVRRRQHRRDEAEADLRAAVHHFEARGWHHAVATGPALHLAEVLGERGERDEALALARASAERLEAAGYASAGAAARRVEGLVTGGDEGIALLGAAAAALEGSTLHRQRGWALYEHGAALRRAGHRSDAREPLRAALDVAARVESARLTRIAREELLQTGARPARDALSGPASLTPSERRVADLALGGLTNREIAETLWVTRKTVELHLGAVYGKLGIRSRRQLEDVLGAPSDAAAA